MAILRDYATARVMIMEILKEFPRFFNCIF